MASNPLLTIAIPTYNRSSLLKKTLQAYTADPAFDARVEIVISDNCSDDNTANVVRAFTDAYPNIRYHRNTENIRDRNFTQAMNLGAGEYVKLTNDTAEPKPGSLSAMLDIVEKRVGSKTQLFFYQNSSQFTNTMVETDGLDAFIGTASFFAGWILNFGAWRSDFAALTDRDRCAQLQFVQVDWTLRLVQQKRTATIFFNDYFTVQDPGKKNVYNIFNVFLGNYLSLYTEYLQSGVIRRQTLANEKRNLFRHFIVPWIDNIFITNRIYGSVYMSHIIIIKAS